MTSDKRTHFTPPRDALLVTQGLNPCGCVISSVDIRSDEVMLSLRHLTSPSVISHFSANTPQTVDLHVLESGNSRHPHLHLKGRVCPGDDQKFVLSVNNDDDLSVNLEALYDLPAKQQVLSDRKALNGLQRLYQQHAIRFLEQLLPAFIDAAERAIEQALEHAAELREITRLKDIRYIFNSRQAQIYQNFEARFSANSALLATSPTSEKHTNELHVLQQHVFEDWLDLQTVASRLTKDHPGTLFALNQLLNQMFGQDITNTTNPLSPGALCACLQVATDRLGITSQDRHTIYRAFETVLQEIWAPAMQSFIKDCARAGLNTLEYDQLPPNWSLRDSQTPGAGHKSGLSSDPLQADSGDAAELASPQETADTEPAPQPTDQPLFRLLGLEQGGARGWQRSSDQFCARLKPKRADLLEKLQAPQPELSQAIRELSDADQEFGNSVDQATLEKASFVDQLFAPLQSQSVMSAELQDKLEQLRLPVFEALLDTPEFLNEEDHPAREIVNDLMRLCFAERTSTKSLESTVSGIIDELIHAEDLNHEQLQGLKAQLKKLVERQDQSFLRNSERLAKTLEGKERLKETRRQVQHRLDTMLGGKEIPQVLLDLLESGWEQLMVLALLREGPNSHHYGELLEVVGLLQTWLIPDAQNDELAFERELESGPILHFIDRELRAIGDIGRFRSVMADLTGQLQQHQTVSTVFLKAYGDAQTPHTGPDEIESDRWTTRARELAVGHWIELTLDDGDKRKLRLVWGGEDVLRFVFLSPTGMSEISFDFAEFVQKLRTGEASLVEEGDIPFVDQSLFNMVQDVYRRLNFQATHDALTGCMHRHDFEKLVSALLARSENADQPGALVVMDIDEFSVINATYGAQAGDRLLQATGELAQKHCRLRRPEPHAGRISGNEFAILMDQSAVEDSLDFAERLRQDFENQVFSHGDAEYQATLSVSVCPISQAFASAGDLLNSASLSLKSVKRLGGNRVELVKGSGQPAKSDTPQWVSEIDRSIRDGSLFLRAQPIVPLNRSASAGKSYELLLGMTDASGNQVSPQAYIEAAERFRRSTQVDLWVVQEVLDWMRANPLILSDIGTLNVNLSGASLSDDRFMLELEALLKAHRDLAPKICFEVTETSAVANLHYAADFMRELKRLECRFALDDFGTGLSSYAYLQKLPVDYVKIDGIFVKDMTTNLTNYAMVRSINELCHFLDLKTIAEYVEDMEIFETLKEIQVDFAQGFGIAKPRRLDSLKHEARTPTGLCL